MPSSLEETGHWGDFVQLFLCGSASDRTWRNSIRAQNRSVARIVRPAITRKTFLMSEDLLRLPGSHRAKLNEILRESGLTITKPGATSFPSPFRRTLITTLVLVPMPPLALDHTGSSPDATICRDWIATAWVPRQLRFSLCKPAVMTNDSSGSRSVLARATSKQRTVERRERREGTTRKRKSPSSSRVSPPHQLAAYWDPHRQVSVRPGFLQRVRIRTTK